MNDKTDRELLMELIQVVRGLLVEVKGWNERTYVNGDFVQDTIKDLLNKVEKLRADLK